MACSSRVLKQALPAQRNTSPVSQALSHLQSIKKLKHRFNHRSSCWRHFHNWDSFYQNATSLCQADINLVTTIFILLWILKLYGLGVQNLKCKIWNAESTLQINLFNYLRDTIPSCSPCLNCTESTYRQFLIWHHCLTIRTVVFCFCCLSWRYHISMQNAV